MTILKSLTMKWWYQNHKILFRWFPPETEVDQTRFNSLLQKSFIAVLIHLQLLLIIFDDTHDESLNVQIFQKSGADQNSEEIGGMFFDHFLEI